MKKIILITLLTFTTIIAGCTQDTHTQEERQKISYYTCPMHPQIHRDEPGNCPICGMTLVPVFEEGEKPAAGLNLGVSISPERQQLIGVKTETVSKKQITKEIQTSGSVAFDPELAVAISEYKEIIKNAPTLKKAAFDRLQLMGLDKEEIKTLSGKNNGKNLYLPSSSQPVWVYAPFYESEMDFVGPGMEATITLPSGEEKIFDGIVRSLTPVVDSMSRTVTARIEVTNAEGKLKPNTYVNVTVKVDLGEKMAVAKSAIVATGTRRLVFVVHDGTHFESREVTTSIEAGDWVVITDGLKEEEIVATSAVFLIDSESQLKAAVSSY